MLTSLAAFTARVWIKLISKKQARSRPSFETSPQKREGNRIEHDREPLTFNKISYQFVYLYLADKQIWRSFQIDLNLVNWGLKMLKKSLIVAKLWLAKCGGGNNVRQHFFLFSLAPFKQQFIEVVINQLSAQHSTSLSVRLSICLQ